MVLAILVALSAMIIPLIGGLSSQANSSINATSVRDVARTIATYQARYEGSYPDYWDSLADTSDQRFGKLTLTVKDLLQVTPLTESSGAKACVLAKS